MLLFVIIMKAVETAISVAENVLEAEQLESEAKEKGLEALRRDRRLQRRY